MPDLKEKLVELLYTAEELADTRCDGYPNCDNCPANGKRIDCMDWLKADCLLSLGVTVQKWIPVSERLPNEDEYTAKAKYGEEYYVRLLIAHKTDIIEYEIGYYDGYKWMTEMPIRLIKDVVAWMPFPNMPQPPKGE